MNSPQRRIAIVLYRWHRLLGVMAALFIVLLAVTGILLNHTDDLGLARTHVTARPLLAWYGIHAPDDVAFFAAGTHHVSQWEDRLLLDTIDLGNHQGHLRGAVASGDLIVAALDHRLVLLLDTGQLADVVEDLPQTVQRVGLDTAGAVILDTPAGRFAGNAELTAWTATPSAAVRWSTPIAPPPVLHDATAAVYLGSGLPLERVVADLHSGRLFTRHGPWLMDTVALVLIFSTASGLWLWWRNHVRPRRH